MWIKTNITSESLAIEISNLTCCFNLKSDVENITVLGKQRTDIYIILLTKRLPNYSIRLAPVWHSYISLQLRSIPALLLAEIDHWLMLFHFICISFLVGKSLKEKRWKSLFTFFKAFLIYIIPYHHINSKRYLWTQKKKEQKKETNDMMDHGFKLWTRHVIWTTILQLQPLLQVHHTVVAVWHSFT